MAFVIIFLLVESKYKLVVVNIWVSIKKYNYNPNNIYFIHLHKYNSTFNKNNIMNITFLSSGVFDLNISDRASTPLGIVGVNSTIIGGIT